MKENIEKEDIKKLIIEIFKDVIIYCDNNNLKYILYYGTLLGAVRHEGFIPWDIDMDIAMPRPDYEKFIKNYKPKNKNITLFDHDKFQDFFFSFAKVVDNRTICDEHYKGFKQNPYGAYLDIFPIDGIATQNSERIMKRAKKLRILIALSRLKTSTYWPLHYNMGIGLANVLFGWMPYKKMLNELLEISKTTDYETSENVAIIAPGSDNFIPLRKDLIEDITIGIFENIECKIPINYEEILSMEYGDYMTLHPENKRIDSHTYNHVYWKR